MDDGHGWAAPVGSYPAGASPYGALDMAGNVLEWVADWYAADYYSPSPARNPLGPDSGQSRVMRGGSYSATWFYVRAAFRGHGMLGKGYIGVGFRCAGSPGAEWLRLGLSDYGLLRGQSEGDALPLSGACWKNQ